MIKEMCNFNWGSKKYIFNAKQCYDGDGTIKLPDGTLLRVESWASLIPLKPKQLIKINPCDAALLE